MFDRFKNWMENFKKILSTYESNGSLEKYLYNKYYNCCFEF